MHSPPIVTSCVGWTRNAVALRATCTLTFCFGVPDGKGRDALSMDEQ